MNLNIPMILQARVIPFKGSWIEFATNIDGRFNLVNLKSLENSRRYFNYEKFSKNTIPISRYKKFKVKRCK